MKNRVSSIVFRAAAAVWLVGFGFSGAFADIPASAYVQDGLIVQFDGIDNAGTGTHDPNATAWVDLVTANEGAYDMMLTSYGSFDENALVANGSKSAAKGTSPAGTIRQIEGCFTLDSDKTANSVLYSSGRVDGSNMDWIIGLLNNHRGYIFGGSAPMFAVGNDYSGLHTISSTKAVCYYDGLSGSVTKGSNNSFGKTDARKPGTSAVGGFGDGDTPCAVKMHALRLYNRTLSVTEVSINANIDKMRFEGADSATLTWPEGYRWNAGENHIEHVVCIENEGGHGSVAVDGVDIGTHYENWFAVGSVQTGTVMATANDGYVFSHWSGDTNRMTAAEIHSSTVQVPFDVPKTLTANFVLEGSDPAWIASSGKEYIDTGFFAGAQSRVVVDFAAVADSYAGRIVGASLNQASNAFSFALSTSGSGTFWFDAIDGSVQNASLSSTVKVGNQRHVFDLNLPNCTKTLDGTNSACAKFAMRTANVSLGIFGDHQWNKWDNKSKTKLYSLALYHDDTLKHYFLPSIKDGVPQLKDVVTGRFCPNEGTGGFTYGGTITPDPTKLPDGWKFVDGKLKCRLDVSDPEGGGTFSVNGGAAVSSVTTWLDPDDSLTVEYFPASGRRFVMWQGYLSKVCDIMQTTLTWKRVGGARSISPLTYPDTAKWVYTTLVSNETAYTCVSNTYNRFSYQASLSGTNVTLESCFDVAGQTVVDFTLPVTSEDGTEKYAFTAAKSMAALGNRVEAILFPDSITGNFTLYQAKTVRALRMPINYKLGSTDYRYFSELTALYHLSPGVFPLPKMTSFPLYGAMNLYSLIAKLDLSNVTSVNQNGLTSGYRFDAECLELSDKFSAGTVGINELPMRKVKFTETRTSMPDFQNCHVLASVEPFFGPLVKTLPNKGFYRCWELEGDMKLSCPDLVTIPASCFEGTAISSVDMTGSGVESDFKASCFKDCTRLTNIVFSAALATLPNVTAPFGGCTSLSRVYFRGDAPDVKGATFDTARAFAVFVPRWNASWQAYLANGNCTVSEMTAADEADFLAKCPGAPLPVQKVNLGNVTGAKYLCYWSPDRPTALSEGDITFPAALAHDGVIADCGAASKLFDETVYARSVPSLGWTVAAGTEATLPLPENATLARGLRIVGYRVHQLSCGEYVNARAPTAWTLSGQLADGSWVLLDEQHMTGDSPNHWACFDDPSSYDLTIYGVAPDLARCALTYVLAPEKQRVYVAYKFVPTASYQTDNGIDDPTPIGLMEVELLAALPSPAPAIAQFETVSPKPWKALSFTARVGDLGVSPDTGLPATTATAHVDVATEADFSDAVSSAEVDLSDKTAKTVTVPSLEPGASYWVRLVSVNNFGYASTNVLAEAVQALAVPMDSPALTCTRDASGKLVAQFGCKANYADATIAIAYGPAPHPETGVASGSLSAGETARSFDAFAADDTIGFVKATVRMTEGGETYADELEIFSRPVWLGNTSAPTSISNVWNGIVINCQTSSTNITLKAFVTVNGQEEVDLTTPVCDANLRLMAITAVSGTFDTVQGKAACDAALVYRRLLLPDTITSLPYWTVRHNEVGNGSALEYLKLPAKLASLGYLSIASCPNLTTVEPFLPDTLGSIGMRIFEGSPNITGALNLRCPRFMSMPECVATKTKIGSVDMRGSSITSILYYAFTSCSMLTNVYLSSTLRSVQQNSFESSGALKRVYFTGKPPESVYKDAFDSPTGPMCFFVPKQDADWLAWLAAAEGCAVRAPEPEERVAFAEAFGGEGRLVNMIKIPATATKWRYLTYWWPNGEPRGLMIFVK